MLLHDQPWLVRSACIHTNRCTNVHQRRPPKVKPAGACEFVCTVRTQTACLTRSRSISNAGRHAAGNCSAACTRSIQREEEAQQPALATRPVRYARAATSRGINGLAPHARSHRPGGLPAVKEWACAAGSCRPEMGHRILATHSGQYHSPTGSALRPTQSKWNHSMVQSGWSQPTMLPAEGLLQMQ